MISGCCLVQYRCHVLCLIVFKDSVISYYSMKDTVVYLATLYRKHCRMLYGDNTVFTALVVCIHGFSFYEESRFGGSHGSFF